ncbi:iron complex outermembrane receptor protein [Acidovorax soli]|uniref:Iron complex outermembrane receptor protein n=1 Tax=Acidovorax soli TaxID=592050 RepID=A0A7X0P8S7_9BURK|nr:TonB-dependent siderophore receptor [Acidovorax soli]MBB6557403.1 iron complex outermembrane receptor protein [Acidovorax soli]
MHSTRRPTRGTFTAQPFALRQIAQACAWTLLAGTGAAMAQQASTAPSLKEVTVNAAPETPDSLPAVAPGGQVAKGARLGILGNVGVMDTPFNTTSYTAEGIADQQAQTIGAVLKNDPSVRMTTNEGHVVENFIIRGFAVSANSLAINGVYGLAPEQNTPTEMFERVEVLKGPGAMMMGLPPAGDVGGAINLVPKRAGKDPLTRVTTTWSDQSNVGVHADVARRFGPEQRLGVRVNGVLSGGETWLDHQTKKREIGHLALDYQGQGWSVEADAYSLTNKVRKGVTMQPIITGWTTVPRAPDGSTNFFYGEGVFSNTETQGLIVRGQAQLNAGWTAFASAGHAKHSYDGFIFGTRPVWTVANAATGNATGTAYNSWGEYETSTAELGLRGQFTTGAVAHKLTLAANVLDYEGGSRGNGTANITSNIFNPTPITMPAGAAASTFTRYNDDVLTGLSVVDTLSFAEDKLQLTLGLRAQQVNQKLARYKETAVTPLVGVVAKPWGENISLYGNYVEGLSAGTTVKAPYANEGETFKPYKTQQMEVGVKWAMGDITQTVSLFQISKPALIEANNRQLLDGEQRNRGVEWNIFGQVARGLTLLGGAAYTEAKQTKTTRGVNQGLAQFGVPKLTLNLGADWAIPGVQGLAVSGRVNHTGVQWLTGDNSVKLPGWTTVDVSARYALRVGAQPVVLRATVTNLANKAYYDSIWGAGRVNVGAPRSVRLSAAFDF